MEPYSNSNMICTYADAYAVLPMRLHNVVNNKVTATMKGHNVDSLEKSKNVYRFLIPSGIAVALAGLVLTLAAFRILPSGVNCISQLDRGGRILGIGGMSFGVALAIGANFKSNNVANKNKIIDRIRVTEYLAQVAEMDAYFPHRLNPNEILVIDDSARKQLIIYYWLDGKNDSRKTPVPCKVAREEKYAVSPYTRLETLKMAEKDFFKDKVVIDLATLEARTEEFEIKQNSV